ncbi:TonB-dependent receptor [Duganella sp. Leaf61]|uniref:TonB-dependent receptor n=1 Tax=Duganella sp. Leaf61 TaxID=1736227 RepID=UPI000A9D6606|nr:TonB-dependent receptor [Duganella sp. Leaf61]
MLKSCVPDHAATLALTLSSLTLLAGAPAAAQEQAGAALPEVVVTAQRTPALESKTPVSMTVLGERQLVERGLDNPGDIGAAIPNVEFNNATDGLRITMRGVSSADTTGKGDPSAAFMLDGVYIARPQIQNLSFYDLERVEVLRGPQGTLYGRNTTAGAVNVISKTPVDTFAFDAHAGIGNYRSREAGAMLNVPVNDTLALRAAVVAHRHDSYLRNGQGTPYALGLDRDDVSARLSAKIRLHRDATLLLRADHSRVDDNNDSFVPDTNFYSGVSAGVPVWQGGSTRDLLTNRFISPNSTPSQGYSHKTTSSVGADLQWDLGAATLYYLGSHRDYDQQQLTNSYYRVAPGVALGVHQDFDGWYRQDSHEVRLASKATGPLTGQAGVYYFRERSSQSYTFRDLEAAGLTPYYAFPHGPTRSASKALFGQATYQVRGDLRLTAGARRTMDKKSRYGATSFQQASVFNPATDLQLLNAADLATNQTTWRLGADFDVTQSTMVYASIATGYKAGGFNDGCMAGAQALGLTCNPALAVPRTTLVYQPEQLRAYEAGVKTRFLDQRGALNVSVFSYDYTNLQLSGVAVVAGAPRFITGNAGEASVKGLELEGQFNLTAQDRLVYALSLLDAHYVRYSPDGVHSWNGNKLDRAPAHTVSLGYERSMRVGDGVLAAGLDTRRSADYEIAVASQLLRYRVPARTETGASLRYTVAGGAWSVLARVKNLENKVRPISIDSFGMAVPSDPRTVDLRVDYRY